MEIRIKKHNKRKEIIKLRGEIIKTDHRKNKLGKIKSCSLKRSIKLINFY